MTSTFARTVIATASSAVLALALLDSPSPALADDQAQDTSGLSKDLAVYLGCREVHGPGTVVQLGPTGEVLGTVQLAGTPYGLAVHNGGLLAAVPSAPNGKPGKVIRIDGQGKVASFLQDGGTAPHPISIAVAPDSGDIVVADNRADVLLLLPGGQARNASTILQIGGHENHQQSMSVALAKDGRLLFGGTGPYGIYRCRAEEVATLGEPLLPYFGRVASDPSSGRWVAGLPGQLIGRDQLLSGELRVFEEERETQKLPFPRDKCNYHDTLAFGPDGTLVIAFCHSKRNGEDIGYEVVVADLEAKAFRPLFSWNKSRVVTMAVGPKMNWKK